MKTIHLNHDELQRTNKLYELYKNDDNNIFLKCPICKGTGLDGHEIPDGFFWDGTSFCEFCNGTGHIKNFITDGKIIQCPVCEGSGKNNSRVCETCGGSGYFDWLSSIFMREK